MKKIFIMSAAFMLLLACNNEKKEEAKTEGATTAMSSDPKKPASELLDISAGESVKSSFEAFAKGDIDGMSANYDDNIRYTWSGGDSLKGKQAVKDYYASRWKLIESLKVSNPIVLPIQVNESQQPQAAPNGKWVLYWAMVDVTYKNGKKINFWMHNVNHYNDAGKVDFIGQYLDRHPIIEATKDLMK